MTTTLPVGYEATLRGDEVKVRYAGVLIFSAQHISMRRPQTWVAEEISDDGRVVVGNFCKAVWGRTVPV